jgi:hypothetical protein
MKLLFDERYAPITSTIGFFEADCKRTAEAYVQWQRDIGKPEVRAEFERNMMKGAVWVHEGPPSIVEPVEWVTSSVAGPLSHALEALPPLTRPWTTRFLIVPTASAWTAFFDNGVRGGDPNGPLQVLCADMLKCRGVKIAARPDSLGRRVNRDERQRRGRYGASQFALYGPDMVDHSNSVRGVEAVNDGGTWTFDTSGTPLPFEEPETYKAKRKRDRFPFELLDKYCRALGLRPFDEDFYLPPEQPNATLIERVPLGPPNPKMETYTLAEVQAGDPWYGRRDGAPR